MTISQFQTVIAADHGSLNDMFVQRVCKAVLSAEVLEWSLGHMGCGQLQVSSSERKNSLDIIQT